MFDPPFDISHLYQAEQDRIRSGNLTTDERKKLMRGENPWFIDVEMLARIRERRADPPQPPLQAAKEAVDEARIYGEQKETAKTTHTDSPKKGIDLADLPDRETSESINPETQAKVMENAERMAEHFKKQDERLRRMGEQISDNIKNAQRPSRVGQFFQDAGFEPFSVLGEYHTNAEGKIEIRHHAEEPKRKSWIHRIPVWKEFGHWLKWASAWATAATIAVGFEEYAVGLVLLGFCLVCCILQIWVWQTNRRWPLKVFLMAMAVGLVSYGVMVTIEQRGDKRWGVMWPKLPPPAVETRDIPAPTFTYPHINLTFVIDSVRDDTVFYHFQLENGAFAIKNIRVGLLSKNFKTKETLPRPTRTVPPGGKLKLPGVLVGVFDSREYNLLTVYVAFVAEISGTDKNFTSTYNFSIEPGTLRPQPVDPSSLVEREGHAEYEELFKEINSMLANFAQPKATMAFGINEIKNGRPNVQHARNEFAEYVFNPISRNVFFKMRMDSGRWASVEFTLPKTDDGRHYLTLGWDRSDDGVFLAVDGVTKSDMKSRKRR